MRPFSAQPIELVIPSSVHAQEAVALELGDELVEELASLELGEVDLGDVFAWLAGPLCRPDCRPDDRARLRPSLVAFRCEVRVPDHEVTIGMQSCLILGKQVVVRVNDQGLPELFAQGDGVERGTLLREDDVRFLNPLPAIRCASACVVDSVGRQASRTLHDRPDLMASTGEPSKDGVHGDLGTASLLRPGVRDVGTDAKSTAGRCGGAGGALHCGHAGVRTRRLRNRSRCSAGLRRTGTGCWRSGSLGSGG